MKKKFYLLVMALGVKLMMWGQAGYASCAPLTKRIPDCEDGYDDPTNTIEHTLMLSLIDQVEDEYADTDDSCAGNDCCG